MEKLIQIKDSEFKTSMKGGYRKGAGRKPIGITRKISLTLPQACWEEIDRYCQRGDYARSEVIRAIIEDNLSNTDLL